MCDSVKSAATRKQDQHKHFKVQNTDLAAREAYYNTFCWWDNTREDDRHQETIKDTKTIEEQASNKTTYFQYIVMLKAASFRNERMTTLREKYETGIFHVFSVEINKW